MKPFSSQSHADTGEKPLLRRRGRPRAYDEDKVLKAMRNVFWAKGFAATTLDDLCTAAEINRPSLYGGFGDKSEIYLKILKNYSLRLKEKYLSAFMANLSLEDGLNEIFAKALTLYVDENLQPLGCLLMSVAFADMGTNAKVNEIVLSAFSELKEGYLFRLSRAVKQGELPQSAPLNHMADLLFALHLSIAIRTRAGESADLLQQEVKQAIGFILKAGRAT